jgi:hypothetical protein
MKSKKYAAKSRRANSAAFLITITFRIEFYSINAKTNCQLRLSQNFSFWESKLTFRSFVEPSVRTYGIIVIRGLLDRENMRIRFFIAYHCPNRPGRRNSGAFILRIIRIFLTFEAEFLYILTSQRGTFGFNEGSGPI